MLLQPLHNESFLRAVKDTQGVTILEIIIIVAVLTVSMAGILGLASFSLLTSTVAKQTEEAALLAQETTEALRNYRDGIPWNDNDAGDEYDGLGVVTASSSYYMKPSLDTPPRWRLLSGTGMSGIYTRSVVFRNICRNSSTDDITGITDSNGTATTCGGSGGAHDTDTMEATVTVSWVERDTAREVELVMYLTNWNL